MNCPVILKRASPRWVKMVRSGKLGRESLKRLAEAGYKDRTIKPLGRGAFRIADLVFTEGIGKAVRKIPLIDRKSASDIIGIYKAQAMEHKVWNKARKLMHKKGIPVAKMVKRNKGIGYYEYIKGRKISDKAAIIKKNMVPNEYPREGTVAEKIRWQKRIISINKAREKVHKIINANIINKSDYKNIKKRFPHLRDTTAQNTIGNTLIDFDITNYKAFPTNLDMKRNIKKDSYRAMREALNDRMPNNIKIATMTGDINRARKDTNINPSDAQIKAENYKKGSFKWNGLTIKLENPKGSTRSGTDPDGKSWSIKMKYDYGYISNAQDGKDGDKIDVFIGSHPESQIVYVIDQVDKNGKFDEHKCILGALTEDEARKTYLANYEKGWKCGPITAMTVEQFKEWTMKGRTGSPLNKQKLFKVGKTMNCPSILQKKSSLRSILKLRPLLREIKAHKIPIERHFIPLKKINPTLKRMLNIEYGGVNSDIGVRDYIRLLRGGQFLKGRGNDLSISIPKVKNVAVRKIVSMLPRKNEPAAVLSHELGHAVKSKKGLLDILKKQTYNQKYWKKPTAMNEYLSEAEASAFGLKTLNKMKDKIPLNMPKIKKILYKKLKIYGEDLL